MVGAGKTSTNARTVGLDSRLGQGGPATLSAIRDRYGDLEGETFSDVRSTSYSLIGDCEPDRTVIESPSESISLSSSSAAWRRHDVDSITVIAIRMMATVSELDRQS